MTKTFRGKKILTSFIAILCFALCLLLADLFSNLITINSFSQQNSNTAVSKISAFKVYAISIYTDNDSVTADEHSKQIKKMGGGGYIWREKNTFNVLTSAYLEENDAKLVTSNLKESGYSPQIIEINFSEILITTSTFTQNEISVLYNALNCFNYAYKNLYDVSISLDTKLFNDAQTRLEISNISNEINSIKTNYSALFSAKQTSTLLKLKVAIENVHNIVNTLVNFTENETENLSSKIKGSYLEILSHNKDFCNTVSSV